MENQTFKRKKIVGLITIRKYTGYKTMRGYLSKEFRDLIKSDVIVFNVKKFCITLPTLDTRITKSVKAGYFSFIGIEDAESYAGKYKIIQKDEDTFVLKRVKIV